MTAALRRAAPLVFHLIPHTHWDREWYLGAAAFRARLVPLLDDLLDRLARDPLYRTFLLDGQSVLIADYLAVRPEQEPLVQRLAADGRLQLGPWYVLADELVPSGESLVRNLLLGARDAARWGGGYLDALYSPDMFGHPAALPAIAREFGIMRGALWRGLHPAHTGGRDIVRWAAPDGRTLLLYHLPRDGYEVGVALPVEPDALARRWAPLRRTLVERAATPHIAILVGADHHTPHPELPALRDALAALEPDHEVRISRLDDFLAAAEAALDRDDVGAVTGELRDSYGYTWTLQGVHSTRAPQKRRHAHLELLLERGAEPLAALAALAGSRDERPLLRMAWRGLIECQFHDAIAGCASDEVARAVDARFDSVAGTAGEVARRALFALAGHDPDAAREAGTAQAPALLLWNPAARVRDGVVIADLTFFRRDVRVGPPGSTDAAAGGPGGGARPLVHSRLALRAPDRTILPVQVLERTLALERVDAAAHYPDLDEVERVRVAFAAPAVGPLGTARLELADTAPRERSDGAGVRRAGRTIANRFVEVTVQTDGTITLADRLSGERYPGLLAWEGEDDVGDTYTSCPAPDGGVTHPAGAARVRDLADGPLMAALEIHTALATGRAEVGEGSGWVDVRTVVMVFADDPAVRIRVELVNAARDHRLRLRCPVGLPGRSVLAGSTFGVIHRDAAGRAVGASPSLEPPPVHAGSRPATPPVGETRPRTAPAHRLVAAADGTRGLALLAPGFFEYEWTETGDLVFTALRATGVLSRGDLPTRPGHAGWTMPTPAAQCLGGDRLELALLPSPAAALQHPDELMGLWENCFLPLRGWWLRSMSGAHSATSRPPSHAPTVALEGAGLVVSAIKPAEHGAGIVLRCCNLLARPAAGAWRTGWDLTRAVRVRADETKPEQITLGTDPRTVRFTVPARGMATIIVA